MTSLLPTSKLNEKVEETKKEILESFTNHLIEYANNQDEFADFLDCEFPENELAELIAEDIAFIKIGFVQIGYSG